MAGVPNIELLEPVGGVALVVEAEAVVDAGDPELGAQGLGRGSRFS